jgi:hypothetical protein
MSFLERAKGLEPSTPTLARLYSTTELRPLKKKKFKIKLNIQTLKSF